MSKNEPDVLYGPDYKHIVFKKENALKGIKKLFQTTEPFTNMSQDGFLQIFQVLDYDAKMRMLSGNKAAKNW